MNKAKEFFKTICHGCCAICYLIFTMVLALYMVALAISVYKYWIG